MAYGLKYTMSFENDLDEFYDVYFEYLNFIGVPKLLNSSVDSVELRSVDGDEDKLYPILGTECILSILVGKSYLNKVVTDDSTLTIFDLIATQDNQIRITLYKDRNYTTSYYQGFVVVEDNSQPFLDPPWVLTIRALDGLGLLKNVDMVDTNGNLFNGILSVEDWIGNCLYKTGQTLPLRVYWPFYPAGASENSPPLQNVFLDAITWMQGDIVSTDDPTIDVFQSEALDVYSVLEEICRCFRARLFQEDGVWNFVCLYSYVDPNGLFFNESTGILTAGVYHMATTNQLQGQNYDVPIQKFNIIHPVDNDAMLYLKLPTKWVKLNYTYDQSANKICNQNLAQGTANPTYNGTIPSSVQDPTVLPPVTFITKGFDAFCFTHLDGNHFVFNVDNASPYPNLGTAPVNPAYIRSVQDQYGFEFDRYLTIEKSTNPMTFLRSSRILVDVADIFQLSFQWRTRDNIAPSGAGTFDVACVYLYGDDGSHWAMFSAADGDPTLAGRHWVSLDANFLDGAGTTRYVTTPANLTASNQWTEVDCNLNKAIALATIPVSGQIEIIFPVYQTRVATSNEFWIKDITITLLPYLQGSYAPLKGDYNYSASNNAIKQTLTETVEISDSPKRYFKGALVDASHNLIPPTWHRRGSIEAFRFTQLMERIMYNNLLPMLQKIEGTFLGLTYVNAAFQVKQSGYINSYFFLDHPVSPTMKFILTSFDKDLGKGKGRCVFVQILVDQNDTGWANPDSYIFKYLFQSS